MDMPERIWADLDKHILGTGRWRTSQDNAPWGTEYVRADLAPTWQAIETAPKDGTPVLLFGRIEWETYGNPDDEPVIVVGNWVHEYYIGPGWLVVNANPYSDYCHATHWMPLPLSPYQVEAMQQAVQRIKDKLCADDTNSTRETDR